MNTEQSYVGGGNFTSLTTQVDAMASKITSFGDNRPTKPKPFPLVSGIDPAFLSQFRLSTLEQQRAGLLTVATHSMVPSLPLNTVVLAVALNPIQYYDVLGKVVAVALESTPQQVFFGRLSSVDAQQLKLAYDCPRNQGVTLNRLEIVFLYQVCFIVTKTVI